MPPKYPWQRTEASPSTSGSTGAARANESLAYTPAAGDRYRDRAVVVSASGPETFSPNANNVNAAAGGSGPGLGVDSSPQLRIRNSPRTGNIAGSGGGAFGNQRDSYPSPSACAARTPARHAAGAGADGARSGSGASASGAGSRVRTIFGRRRNESDASADPAAVPLGGLDVSLSPAGTPTHARGADAAGGKGAKGGWRQVPVDSPGSSTAGSPAPALAHGKGQNGAGTPVAVKRFDARGYPTRDDLHAVSATGAGDSPSKTTLLRSRASEDNLSVNSTDSTGAAVGGAYGSKSGGGGLFGLLGGVGSSPAKGQSGVGALK